MSWATTKSLKERGCDPLPGCFLQLPRWRRFLPQRHWRQSWRCPLLYSTDIRNKGHYLDLVFKVGHYNTDYTAYAEEGEKIRGDFANTGVALSAEYGRKKSLSSDGWYIEPQTQLSLGYFGGDKYTTSNGVNVDQDGIRSAIGRIGFNFGKDLGEKARSISRPTGIMTLPVMAG